MEQHILPKKSTWATTEPITVGGTTVASTELPTDRNKPCKAAKKYRIGLDNALCQKSVEQCSYCNKNFYNKLDALVHNTTHAVVSLKRLQLEKYGGTGLLMTDNRIPEDERVKALLQIMKIRKYGLGNDGQKQTKCAKTAAAALKLIKVIKTDKSHSTEENFDTKEKVGHSIKKMKTLKSEDKEEKHRLKHCDEANKRPDSNSKTDVTASEEENNQQPNNLLHSLVADCKVNVEPMICDSDGQNFIQKVKPKAFATLLPPSFTTNGRVGFSSAEPDKSVKATDDKANIPNILSSFTNECRVVLDNPLIDALLPKTKVLKSDDEVKPNEVLDSFTSECTVLLGQQMIFDDEPADDQPLSVLASPTTLPEPAVPESHEEEPLVNILNMNDYDSLIKPLICYCPLCPQVFPNRFQLYTHKVTHLRITFHHATLVQLSVSPDVPPKETTSAKEHTTIRVMPNGYGTRKPPNSRDTPDEYGVHCAACKQTFQCVNDLVHHAARHVNESLNAEERRFLPSRSRVYKECEICYRAKKSPRRLIGQMIVASDNGLHCSVCNKLRSHFKLYWIPRTKETKYVVIDLCEDEPEELDSARRQINSDVNSGSDVRIVNSIPSRNAYSFVESSSSIQGYSNVEKLISIEGHGHSNVQQINADWEHVNSNMTSSSTQTNFDSDMATLVLNPAPNHDYDVVISKSNLAPSNSSTDSTFILGESSMCQGQAKYKKDYVNTVWEHAFSDFLAKSPKTVPGHVNPSAVDANLTWNQANSPATINNSVQGKVISKHELDSSKSKSVNAKHELGNSKSNEVNAIRGQNDSKRKFLAVQRKTIKERIAFEDDYVPKVSKPEEVVMKPRKTLTNAERLANIHRKLKRLKPAGIKFSNNFHRKYV